MKIKLNTKKIYNVVFRLLVGVLICVAVALIPTIYLSIKSPITDKFIGNRSDYQGVLEIWHIDTFEGGTLGKYQYLKARAIDFEANNKGLYFMVKNMTETECMLALKDGQMPAMFSFGVGIGEQILQYLTKLNISQTSVRSEFLSAGMTNQTLYAMAWCRGVYSLISTQDNLANAQQNVESSLSSIATTCGYTTTLKNNKVKTTYSLAFGSAGYVCPQLAFANSYQNLVKNQTSIDISNIEKTSYQAYCDFIEGKATILLGTQRDVARVENRVSQGKLDGVVYEHLTDYTDLVQYLGIAQNLTEQQYLACLNFIQHIISNQSQQKLANIGMFSVLDGSSIYSSGEWQIMETLANNSCIAQNVFSNKEELVSNKQSCIDVQQI